MKESRKVKVLNQVVFVLPAVILFTTFVIIPFIFSFVTSFSKWNGVSNDFQWTGISNYLKAVEDAKFINSFVYTVKNTVVVTVIANTIGLVLALVLTCKIRGSAFFRTAFVLPNILSGIILGFIWKFIFMKGLPAIGEIIGFDFLEISWLGTPVTAFWSIVIVSGLCLLLFLAPFYLVIINSFKDNGELLTNIISWPKRFTLENYQKAYSQLKYAKVFSNSLIVTIAGNVGVTVFSAMAAYRLERFPSKGNKAITFILLAGLIIPFQVVMIPLVKVLAVETVPGEKVTIKVLQFKTELSDQMIAMADDYMKEHPEVDLQVESVISSDYDTVLKTRFASGEEPDIFNNEGYNKMVLWMDYLDDLSDQPWVKDMLDFTKEGITSDGKIYGMPLYIESYGFLYNKDYFEQAGITEVPVTLADLTQAVELLEAAGIAPFSVLGAEWYSSGVFLANVPMAQQDNPTEFIKELNDGTAAFTDNKIYQDWMDLVTLQNNHAVSDPMSVDFGTVVSDFANEKVAIILGTNG